MDGCYREKLHVNHCWESKDQLSVTFQLKCKNILVLLWHRSFHALVILVCVQVELITTQAMKAGFTGGLVVDYPNSTRAKK